MINKITNLGFITEKGTVGSTGSLVISCDAIVEGSMIFNGTVTGSGFPTGSIGPQGPQGDPGPTTGYDRLALDASTIAMWYFDGDSNDSGPNSYDLSVEVGEPRYQIGPKRRKFLAPEVPTNFHSTASALMTGGNSTFECVMRLGFEQADAVLATSGDSNSWNWSVQIGSAGRYVVKVYFSEFGWDTNELLSNVTISFNELFHIAVTRAIAAGNTTTKIYLNGVNVGEATVNGSTPRVAENIFYVNSWHDDAHTVYENNGKNQIRQMHVCSRVMSEAEIQERAIAVLPPGYLVA